MPARSSWRCWPCIVRDDEDNSCGTIAVGTALTGRPPHRSVREALPHTAPTLSQTSRPAPRVLLRLRNSMVGPALWPAMRARGEFPSVEPLPSAGSARGSRTRVCSPASSVLRVRLTARRSACRPYRPRRSPTGPRQETRTPLGSPGSRVWNFHACSGSSTPPQTPAPHLGGAGVVAFSLLEQDRPAKFRDFGAQWLACVYHPNGRFDERRYRPRPPWVAEVTG